MQFLKYVLNAIGGQIWIITFNAYCHLFDKTVLSSLFKISLKTEHMSSIYGSQQKRLKLKWKKFV